MTPDGPVIHIFGRDVKGKAVRLDVTGFRPYFYIPADQAEGTPASIAGHRLNPGQSTDRYVENPFAGCIPSTRLMCGRYVNGTGTLRPISRLPPGI